MGVAICILSVLFIRAILHGGTGGKRPTVDMKYFVDVHPTIYYDDDHDISELLEED